MYVQLWLSYVKNVLLHNYSSCSSYIIDTSTEAIDDKSHKNEFPLSIMQTNMLIQAIASTTKVCGQPDCLLPLLETHAPHQATTGLAWAAYRLLYYLSHTHVPCKDLNGATHTVSTSID